jgi:hypothetical protein
MDERRSLARAIFVALICAALTFAVGAKAQTTFTDATLAGPFGSSATWGASWGFLDTDPYPDLFLNNHRNRPSIFQNMGDGTFEDVTELVDVEGYWDRNPRSDTHAITLADIDNDGDQDVVIPLGGSGSQSGSQVFINDNGLLRERSEELGFGVQRSGRMGIWFDYNQDSLLDVLMLSRLPETQLLRNDGNGFTDVTAETAMDCNQSGYGFLADLHPTDGTTADGRMEVICSWQRSFPVNAYQLPASPLLDPTFVDVTASLEASFPTAFSSKDAAIFDFNNDLRPDVYSATGGNMRPADAKQAGPNGVEAYFNPSVRQTTTFRSNGLVTFTIDSNLNNTGRIFIGAVGLHPTSLTFTLDPLDSGVHGIAPHDRADHGIYVGYDPISNEWTFEHNAGPYRTHLNATSTSSVSNVAFAGRQSGDFPVGPRLFLSSGSGYQETTLASGFTEGLMCITVAGGDFDNDGYVDLYLGCRGGVENLPNRLYMNQGDGSFVEVPNAGGAAGVTGLKVFDGAGQTDSVITADYDLDGNLDLFVANGINLQPEFDGGPYQLFRNQGHPTNRWIQLDLVGVISNRDAIGARVIARTATLPPQLREHNGGYHRWSQNLNRVHFGLGSNSTVDLEVHWPSGGIDTFASVAANALYRVTEGGAIEAVTGGEVTISVADADVVEAEGAVAEFTVSLSRASGETITVSYATEDGSATAGQDYTAVSGTLTFPAGETTQTIAVPIVNDTDVEGPETFTLGLTGIVSGNATIADATATGTIDDARVATPEANVSDAAVVEGDGVVAEFTVSLSEPGIETIEVSYTTVEGSATAGQDYTAVSGTLIFPAGETAQTIAVPIVNDTDTEGTETFTLELTGIIGGNATIANGIGTGTISDDDSSGIDCGEPTILPYADKAAFLWRDCATGDWRLRVSAGGDSAGAFYTGRILADTRFDTATGYSIEGHDTLDLGNAVIGFTLKVWNQGVDGIDFSYPAGTSACFELDAPNDLPVLLGPQRLPQQVPLDLETLAGCGTLQLPALSVSDAAVVEGDGVVAEFTVTLSQPGIETVEVTYTTVDGSATAGEDYTAVSGTLTFPAGETVQTVAVPIVNDSDVEGPETFTLELTGIVGGNATIADGSGTGTIGDDDTNGIDCGEPTILPYADKAAFLWRDCATGDWRLRVAAGGDPDGAFYTGRVLADTVFESATGNDIESHDTLDLGNAAIGFTLKVWNRGIDGIDFSYPAGTSACFELDTPNDVPVLLGPQRLPQQVPLDLETLGSCN